MEYNSTSAAYVLIDMEQGFLSPQSPHCIKEAAATIPACERTLTAAREKGIPVFFVKRLYRADGSDVELTRYRSWLDGGCAMTPGSSGPCSAQAPLGLRPQPGDYSIIKPRWSAFFQTELDLILRRLGIRTVILAGTTTPNCIRTTCYDANALDYNVVVLTDCCSSQTAAIQQANLDDMARMGAILMDSGQFLSYCPDTVPDTAQQIREEMLQCPKIPEPFSLGDHPGWADQW